MAYNDQQSITVGTTSTAVLARDTRPRDVVILTNNADEEMFLGIGEDAVLNEGICIEAGKQFAMRRRTRTMENESINAICSSGSKNLAVYIVNARLANFYISVNDSVTVSENLAREKGIDVSVYEAITITDAPTMEVEAPAE